MNGIYLYLLLREIRGKLINRFIDEISVQHRIVQVTCGNDALFVSLYPDAPAVFFSKKGKLHFEKIESFTNEVKACRINRVEQSDFMPVVRLIVEKVIAGEQNPLEIVITLYREAPNFSIKTAQRQRNLFSRYVVKQAKKSITELTAEDLQSIKSQKRAHFAEDLVKTYEGIDKYLANELTSENVEKLSRILSGERVRPRLISIVPLRISLFAHDYVREYTSFNRLLEDGIEAFVEEKVRDIRAARQKTLMKNLRRRIERLRKRLLSDKDIETFRIAGELILMNRTKIKRGMEQARIFNPYSNKESEIKLDPRKTPQENAQYYFSKYKKSKRGQPRLNKKIEELEKEIKTIEAGTFALPELVAPQRPKEGKKSQPFRMFELASGSVVYVGKSARSNEELTFRYARPNDYFFHTRGSEGAHTVLRAKVPKGQSPKKSDLETAASIAAYFSKAKRQKRVPVSYTQCKYIKKNKKDRPGSVVLMREEVIFVEPAIPVDTKQ